MGVAAGQGVRMKVVENKGFSALSPKVPGAGCLTPDLPSKAAVYAVVTYWRNILSTALS
jgi:hypothetical protein